MTCVLFHRRDPFVELVIGFLLFFLNYNIQFSYLLNICRMLSVLQSVINSGDDSDQSNKAIMQFAG